MHLRELLLIGGPSGPIRKLVQYLNETTQGEGTGDRATDAHRHYDPAPYRKRLKQHLTETKRHVRSSRSWPAIRRVEESMRAS
jgi:hypothetical protein